MKPSEYTRPRLRCIKAFEFEDSEACVFEVNIGDIVYIWFWNSLARCYYLDIEKDYCTEYCNLTEDELDEYFELYEE